MEQNVYLRYSEIGETHWWFRSRRVIFDALLGTLKLSEKSKILDFGCGVGSNLKILEKYGSVDAFEPNQLAQKYIKKYQKINLVKKITKKYDLIFLADVIEHINDDKKTIDFLTSRLNKGGFIFISTPAYQFLFSKKDIALHHYRRYNKNSLKKIINNELKLFKLTYFNTILFIPICLSIIFFKVFNLQFINFAERKPQNFFNNLLFNIFSFEKVFIKKYNFIFGLSLLMVLKKN